MAARVDDCARVAALRLVHERTVADWLLEKQRGRSSRRCVHGRRASEHPTMRSPTKLELTQLSMQVQSLPPPALPPSNNNE